MSNRISILEDRLILIESLENWLLDGKNLEPDWVLLREVFGQELVSEEISYLVRDTRRELGQEKELEYFRNKNKKE